MRAPNGYLVALPEMGFGECDAHEHAHTHTHTHTHTHEPCFKSVHSCFRVSSVATVGASVSSRSDHVHSLLDYTTLDVFALFWTL